MRLPATRRHRAAKPLLLIMALFLVGAFYAAFSPAPQTTADSGNSADVAEGKGMFAVHCASCHGLNAEGGSQGPTLVGVGAAAVDFQMGTGRMPAAGGGVQVPRTDTRFTQTDIDKIAAYVASLGPGPAIPGKEQYTGELTDEEIARGGELFRTNCSACHNIGGKGGALPDGKYAPPLTGVESKHIYEALRTGPQQMPVFSKGSLTDQDVTEIIAYLKKIETEPTYGGSNLGGIGPVVEGMAAWILGIGGLALVAVWIAAKGARAR